MATKADPCPTCGFDLAAYEQAEARVKDRTQQLRNMAKMAEQEKARADEAENGEQRLALLINVRTLQRDTAKASEARLREALALAHSTMLRQMASDGATGAPFNEDMDEAITAASAALASTPSLEERDAE